MRVISSFRRLRFFVDALVEASLRSLSDVLVPMTITQAPTQLLKRAALAKAQTKRTTAAISDKQNSNGGLRQGLK
jgi:hypothetical protein